MLKHHPDFVRFKQDQLTASNGRFRPDALDLIQEFWSARCFYVDWRLECGDALMFGNITLAENLS